MAPSLEERGDTTVDVHDAGGFLVYDIVPPAVSSADARVYLELHGGGFVQDGGDICRDRAIGTALAFGVRVWAPDYRMPPDHPFPAAVDDCVASYRKLLDTHRPDDIVIGGSSAGAALTASAILKARDEGLPLPAAAVMNTPCIDLTESGDTWHTNQDVDTVMRGSFMPAFLLYADGHDLRDPCLSPIYANVTKGLPPTILLSGTRDILLSDTVRFHRLLRSADIPAELHVFEAAGHAGFLGMAPEDRERTGEMRRFAEAAWAGALHHAS
jgi:acetyl esterase/lipase